ncbi:MAG: hypothetical protein QM770_05340 [Tepidisphaeraceae bacterium]
MHALSQQIEQINATLVGLAVDDLQGLASAHAQFEQLLDAAKAVPETSEAVVQQLGGITDRSRKQARSTHPQRSRRRRQATGQCREEPE